MLRWKYIITISIKSPNIYRVGCYFHHERKYLKFKFLFHFWYFRVNKNGTCLETSFDPLFPTPISELIRLDASWRNTSNSTTNKQKTVESNIKPSEMECLSLVMASAKRAPNPGNDLRTWTQIFATVLMQTVTNNRKRKWGKQNLWWQKIYRKNRTVIINCWTFKHWTVRLTSKI